ncbi:hypothetical protein EPN42_04780 [bacterium]|nr:MAG: hypothetical protein EPN42_04780 [bacterium]
MSFPSALRTRPGLIVYRGGLSEPIALLPVATGWRVAEVPLGSEAVAFGDYATVRELSDGRLQIIGIRQGGWRTLRSRTVIPPREELVTELAARGWLGRWNEDGYLAVGVPMEVWPEARRVLDHWEASALVERFERGIAS